MSLKTSLKLTFKCEKSRITMMEAELQSSIKSNERLLRSMTLSTTSPLQEQVAYFKLGKKKKDMPS